MENGAKTRGCLCALGEPCKQHGEGRGGFTGRNRCLLSAPVGLLCNNRPVTLRKCREAACVCVCMCVCGIVFFFFLNTCVCVCACECQSSLLPHHQLLRSSDERADRISQARAFSR